MNLSDQDLELLDRYLDGDLNDAAVIGLEARLHADADMAGELAKMREFRSVRAEAFASMEASELESQQLQWYVRGALHQQMQSAAVKTPVSLFHRAGRWAGGLSRVAAVLVLGAVVGYGLRGGAGVSVSPPVVIDQPAGFIPEGKIVAGMGGGAGIVPVGNAVTPAAYEVALTDQFGNVVTTRRFASLQEAREFTNDLAKWQQKHRQVQTNGVRLIGDDF